MKWEPRHHISVQDDNLDREDLFNCLRPGQKQGFIPKESLTHGKACLVTVLQTPKL